MTDKYKIKGVTNLDEFRSRRPDLVYECACGAQHFFLVYSPTSPGSVQCRECLQFLPDMIWGKDQHE